jgi:hypothetical protein
MPILNYATFKKRLGSAFVHLSAAIQHPPGTAGYPFYHRKGAIGPDNDDEGGGESHQSITIKQG